LISQVAVAGHVGDLDVVRGGSKNSYHVIEKFSVDLIAENRVIPTFDPSYPAFILSGSLPHLTLHISLAKVRQVQVW